MESGTGLGRTGNGKAGSWWRPKSGIESGVDERWDGLVSIRISALEWGGVGRWAAVYYQG